MTEENLPLLTAQRALAEVCDLAWAAGVLDARGRFTAAERKHPGGWMPVIRVKAVTPWIKPGDPSTYDGLMKALLRVLGGNVCRPARVGTAWQLTGAKGCVEVIDRALPYMQVQHGRAVALRRLCVQIRDYRRPGFEERGIEAAEVETRRQLYEALRTAI